jgi:hypothetical protein
MPLKPLEPGDSVRVKYVVDIHRHDATVYLNGKLVGLDEEDSSNSYWWVEYQLEPVIGATKYLDLFIEDDITSKHHAPLTDADYFAKAEKTIKDDYEGVLFYDDRYFDSIDEFLKWCDREDIYALEYVWACDTNPVKLQLNLVDYVEQQLEEDGYAGMSELERFQPLYDELRVLQDKFVTLAAKETVSYPNYKKAVIL